MEGRTRRTTPKTPTNPLAGSRKKSLGTPSQVVESPILSLSKNDDLLEKRKRHENQLAEINRKNLSSNISASVASETSLDPGISNLSDSKLSELITTSLKMSAENKINNNNAFVVPIIDLFARMLKNPDYAPNFQMTSRSLDASAKVYSCRVDYVHAETFRIAGELSIGNKKRKRDDKSDEEEEADNAPKDRKRKKRDKKKSKTLESNLKNLDLVKQIDEVTALSIDPLFHQTSLLFSEEGVNGLIFNCPIQDGSCLVYIDSRTRVTRYVSRGPPQPIKMNTDKLRFTYRKFKYCYLIGFDLDEEDSLNVISRSTIETVPTAPLPTDGDTKSPPSKKRSLEEPGIGGDGDEIFDTSMHSVTGLPDNSIFKEPQAPASKVKKEIALETRDSLSDMSALLASEPGEYSYLDDNLISAWAGPLYWKYQPLQKGSHHKQAAGESQKKVRKKLGYLDFNLTLDANKLLAPASLGSAELSRTTMLNWDKKKTTYPKDINYKTSNFVCLGQKPKQKVSLHETRIINDDDELTDYDESDDEDSLHGGPEDNIPIVDAHSSDEEGRPYSPVKTPQTNVLNQEIEPFPFTQESDGIFYNPQKHMEKFTLNYAKRAKRIDVKNLKENMWKLLASNDPSDPTIEPEEKMSKEIYFSELYNQLPDYVSVHNAQSLTVPLAFVCFLHMVNEKTLELVQKEDMKDFLIRQG